MSQRVLMIDDDRLVRDSVSGVLRRGGYEVLDASNVSDALELMGRVDFDAAIVDYELANESGLTVLSALREEQPSCVRILMTGHTDFPMVVAAVNDGEVMRVVRKPFDREGLLSTLSNAFASAERMAQVTHERKDALTREERFNLDTCLKNTEYTLALQPLVRIPHLRRAVAYEALLRSHNVHFPTTLSLLEGAENHDRLNALGAGVFRLAAERLAKLPEHIGLFVNMHPKQLSTPEQLVTDLKPLAAYRHRVTLEITERSRIHALAGWEESIAALRQGGFSLAIDDLGSGYNSLAMLADLQPSYIKLDMELIRDVDTHANKQRLVTMMVTFAEATDALLVAEGVETLGEAQALIDLGTHLLQGNFIGRPKFEPALLS